MPDLPCLEMGTGSGTAGVACINTDRRFIQIELSEEYTAIARRRADDALEGKRQVVLL